VDGSSTGITIYQICGVNQRTAERDDDRFWHVADSLPCSEKVRCWE
jgi:hypothetical protein